MIIENLGRYFPFIKRDAVEYIHTGKFEVIAVMEDGEKVLYDDIDHTIRTLPSDSSELTEDQFRYEFGRRLEKYMIRNGITQEELSERTGIHRTMISQYINYRHTPSFYVVDKIAKALGCSIDEFRYM